MWAVIALKYFLFAILVGMRIVALITGNTVILKPASHTPIIGTLFVEIMKEAGLPDGLLNLVTGRKENRKRNYRKSDVAGNCFY